MSTACVDMLARMVSHRKTLFAITHVELAKRYSGSLLGKIWIILYPVLLLSIYLFVYMVIFKMQFAGSGRLGYVIFVFAGLIPYIGFMEAITSGCLALKQNMHLIKNVILPIELVPVRYVLVAMVGQLVGMTLLFALIVGDGGLNIRLLAFPAVLALEAAMLIGIVMVMSPLALLLPDLTHFVNLGMLFLIFVSPIGFRPDMVPNALRFVIYANPLFYMIDAFRWSLLKDHPFSPGFVAAYSAISIFAFGFGSWFFGRLKGILVDLE
jgi:lipopolysaccharide transport system permease protein